jgi:GNAT superfamily N-acetyltransferase
VNSSFTSPTHRHTTASEQPSAGASCFSIRAAQGKDLSTLAEILVDSFHSREGLGGWLHPILRLGIYEDLRVRLRSNSPHCICLVALDPQPEPSEGYELTLDSPSGNGVIIGTVEMALRCVNPWKLGMTQFPYLSNLAIADPYRRQGGARQLLQACERIALDWGYHELYLHVLENNRPARRLYYKEGYRIHSIEAGWGPWCFGQPKRMLLHKVLKDS